MTFAVKHIALLGETFSPRPAESMCHFLDLQPARAYSRASSTHSDLVE
jgi:hypothetical protein